ncbi:MAG TPA: hypothetical protein VF187_09440, partial [Gemmatimonadales bacterium]
MNLRKTAVWYLALAGATTACGGGTTEPPPPPPPPPGTPSVVCAAKPVTTMNPGEHVVLDPAATSGCLRFPAPGPAGAQYLVVLAS